MLLIIPLLLMLISPLYGEDDESPVGEETLPDEETPFSEETLPDEVLVSEEMLSEPQPSLKSEGSPLDPQPGMEGEAPTVSDFSLDPQLDDDAFFFEAPPLIFEVPLFEPRSFDVIFPNFSRLQRMRAMSDEGLRHSFRKDEAAMFIPAPDTGIDLLDNIMKKNPSHLIEALAVVSYNGKELDLLDIYNALGRIEKIKDYPVPLNNSDFYIFTESTRIESARNRRSVPDPLPAVALPFSDTMYLRLKEINFGNLFLRADISISAYGITYSMTNFTDVRYFLVPIMKAERFISIIYLEPVKEGILIYSVTGFYLPGFIADRVNLTPNINRRIRIFINWITDGLREHESAGTMETAEDAPQ